jgi:hypothetical protein
MPNSTENKTVENGGWWIEVTLRWKITDRVAAQILHSNGVSIKLDISATFKLG